METIEEQITKEKDTHIQLLRETLWDIRDQRNFFKCMMIILSFIIMLLIGGLTCLGMYNQKLLHQLVHDLYYPETTEIVSSNTN